MDCASSPKGTARDTPGESLKNEAGPTRGRASKIAGTVLKFGIVPLLIIVVIYSPRYDEGILLSLDEWHYLAPVDALLNGKTLYRTPARTVWEVLNVLRGRPAVSTPHQPWRV